MFSSFSYENIVIKGIRYYEIKASKSKTISGYEVNILQILGMRWDKSLAGLSQRKKELNER